MATKPQKFDVDDISTAIAEILKKGKLPSKFDLNKLSVMSESIDNVFDVIEKSKPKNHYDPLPDIEALPQYKWVDDIKKYEWIKRVRQIDPGREEWHVRRLKGFGGSEIGALIMARNGEYHPFTSSADIVRGKLLETAPQESKGNLARGSIMEPLVRDEYRKMLVERYGDRVKFRDDLFEVTMNYKDADPKLQWLIGTPDDIVEIDGVLQVIDYKVPKPQNLTDYEINGVPFYYAAQLHHYKIILEKCGYEVGKLTLASLNTDSWTIDERDVEISPQMEQDVIDAGNFYWHDYVMLGEIPPANLEKRATDKIDLPPEILNFAKAYAVSSFVANRAKDQVDALRKSIGDIHPCIDTSVDIIRVGIVNIQAKRVFDEDGLCNKAISEGFPVGDYRVKGDLDQELVFAKLKEVLGITDDEDPRLDELRKPEKLDTPRLVNDLRDANINIGPFILAEELGFSLARSKANEIKDFTEAMNVSSVENLAPVLSKVGETYDKKREHMLLAEEMKRAPQKFNLT